MVYFRHVLVVVGLVLSWPSVHALQTVGPVRIVKGRRSSSSTVSGGSEGSRGRRGHKRKGRGGGGGGRGEGGMSSSSNSRYGDKCLDRYRFSAPGNSNRTREGRGQRKATFRKLKKGGSVSMMTRLRKKMTEASRVPDLSRMLRDGLPYLTRSEATEVQLALAVSLYAHSNSSGSYSRTVVHGQNNDRVKAGVEVCIELGRLGMGRDALLAAILGGVLRPDTSREHSTHPGFGRAPVTLVDIREGFGKNVAWLVEGLEHVTCVEETAHRVLRGRHSGRGRGARDKLGSWAAKRQEDDDDDEPLSLAMLIGAREREPGEPAKGRGRGVKPRSLREASALEQGESLRNLIVSEAADWQVLMLRLAVQFRALKISTSETGGNSSSCKQLARDALLVYAPLAHRLGMHQLRNQIETVAFRRLFPQQFDEVRSATMDRSVVYEKVAETTKATLRRALKDAPAFTSQLTGEVVLQHRIKSPYSMWRKMKKKQVSVEGVFDAVAIRVVLEAKKWQGESSDSHTQRSEDLCYQAMSVIQKLYPWSLSQPRIKDYVVKPKPNGYQSLHATQLVPDITDMTRHGPSVTVEFQVRSKEMHQKAEFGLAAHWSYKESHGMSSLGWINKGDDAAKPTSTPHSDKALGKARVPDSVTSGPELVNWLHQQLQERKVFVFGPDRRIWELDAKATAGDAMGRTYMQRFYEGAVLHDRRGSKGVRTAWVNGRAVDASYLLKNGDIFDVQAASSGAQEGKPQDASAASSNTTRVSDSWRVLSTPPVRRLRADQGS
ncbi:unnamed protein product [Scytosiphon promiscuus]